MNRFAPHKWWLMTLALSLPAVALASVPNIFNPGDLLSSSKVNADFAALDQRLSAVESKLTPSTMSSVLTGVTVVLPNHGGPLPLTTTTFSSTGRGLLVIVTGTSFVQTGTGNLDVQVQFDGAPLGDLNVYANVAGLHEALPTMVFPVPSPTPGAHTITLVNGSNATTNDINDVFSVTIVQLGQ
jgi:hypothetical protein